MEQFKDNLETFAKKHQKSIKKDPDFRQHFMQMCASIGVDPMVSSKGTNFQNLLHILDNVSYVLRFQLTIKNLHFIVVRHSIYFYAGFWSVLGLGSFYTQLAVQAVEVVLASAKSTGGIMTLGELHGKLNKSKTKVTEDISW